jgi:hypothetical protein
MARQKAAFVVTLPLLAIRAEAIAIEINGHLAEVARLENLLLGLDRITANYPGTPLPLTRDILFDRLRGRIGSSKQQGVWRSAADALHADPGAAIEVADPPPPPPPPERAPASYQLPHVAEALARRAAAEQAQEPPTTEAA